MLRGKRPVLFKRKLEHKEFFTKVIRDKNILELKNRMSRFRRAKFTKEELSVIQKKIIPSKDNYNLVHFTDTHFLRNILLKGIHYSEATYAKFGDIKKINGNQFGFALDSYRFYKDDHKDYIYDKSIFITKKGLIKDIFNGFRHKNFFKHLKENNLRNNSELKSILNYYKKYLENNKKLDFLTTKDVNSLHELLSRLYSRKEYITLNRLDSEFRSAMNVCLIFDKEDASNKVDAFGLEREFYDWAKFSINKGSKIKGIMIYKDNFKEVFKTVLETAKTINDIPPIYDYNGNVLWPKVK